MITQDEGIRKSMGSFLNNCKVVSIVLLIFFTVSPSYNQTQDNVPIDRVIECVKSFNFVVLKAGILSDGVSKDVISKLENLRVTPPRSMYIYITQSQFASDIFEDFTTLVNNKEVDVIIIWPSKTMQDKLVIRRICQMSKMKKVPIIALQEGWIEEGAMMYFKNFGEDKVDIVVNETVREVMNFPIQENPLYNLIRQ